MYFMHLPTLRGRFSVNSPLCVLANSENPSDVGLERSSLAGLSLNPRLVPLTRAGGAQAVFRVSKLLGGGASPGVLVDL